MAGPFERLFRIHGKGRGEIGERLRARLLIPEILSQRLEALLPRDGGFGPPLRLEGQVQILELVLLQNGLDLGPQLGSQLALLLNRREHGLAPVLQLAEVFELLLDGPDLYFIQGAGGLFSIAGDEGNRSALVEQPNGGDEALEGDVQQLRDVQKNGSGQRLGFGHGKTLL